MHDNHYFTADGQVQICGKNLTDMQASGMESGSTEAKLPSDDTIIGWAADLLKIQATQELLV